MTDVEWKSWVECPRLAAFPTFLKNECWTRNLRIEIEVDKGWFTETARFKITGPAESVKKLQRDVYAAVVEYNAPAKGKAQ